MIFARMSKFFGRLSWPGWWFFRAAENFCYIRGVLMAFEDEKVVAMVAGNSAVAIHGRLREDAAIGLCCGG